MEKGEFEGKTLVESWDIFRDLFKEETDGCVLKKRNPVEQFGMGLSYLYNKGVSGD